MNIRVITVIFLMIFTSVATANDKITISFSGIYSEMETNAAFYTGVSDGAIQMVGFKDLIKGAGGKGSGKAFMATNSSYTDVSDVAIKMVGFGTGY